MADDRESYYGRATVEAGPGHPQRPQRRRNPARLRESHRHLSAHKAQERSLISRKPSSPRLQIANTTTHNVPAAHGCNDAFPMIKGSVSDESFEDFEEELCHGLPLTPAASDNSDDMAIAHAPKKRFSKRKSWYPHPVHQRPGAGPQRQCRIAGGPDVRTNRERREQAGQRRLEVGVRPPKRACQTYDIALDA